MTHQIDFGMVLTGISLAQRASMAATILSGFLANPEVDGSDGELIADALNLTDRLIQALADTVVTPRTGSDTQ